MATKTIHKRVTKIIHNKEESFGMIIEWSREMEVRKIKDLLNELERGMSRALDRHRLKTEVEILRSRLAVLAAAGGGK